MTVKTDLQDRNGKYPLRVTGMKNLNELHEYLYKNYWGSKFAIVFDETKDEYEPLEKEVFVYFLDEIVEEVASYADCEIRKK